MSQEIKETAIAYEKWVRKNQIFQFGAYYVIGNLAKKPDDMFEYYLKNNLK